MISITQTREVTVMIYQPQHLPFFDIQMCGTTVEQIVQ